RRSEALMRWMQKIGLSLLMMASASAAPAPTTTQSASTDTPVAAAKAFALAFMNPTRDKLRALVIGRTPAEEQAADIWADQLSSQFRLQEVAKSHFGDEGYAALFGHPPRPRPAPDQQQK